MSQPMVQEQEAYLYERVVDRIATLINRGTLRPGERISSVRKLSSQLRVSVSTVLQAYFLLEDRASLKRGRSPGFT